MMQIAPTHAGLWFLLVTLLVPGVASAASPASDPVLELGERIAKENCARCHAVGSEDASTHPKAPPFRTLPGRYPLDNLAEAMAEGIVSGHPDMPVFVFDPKQIDAFLAYLKSLGPAKGGQTQP